MADSQPRIVALQRRIARLSPQRAVADVVVATGCSEIDERIGGGLARGALHEIFADEAVDAAAGVGFAAMLARRIAHNGRDALVWLRVGDAEGSLYPPGLNEVGIDPDRVLLVLAPDAESLMRAAGEVVRC